MLWKEALLETATSLDSLIWMKDFLYILKQSKQVIYQVIHQAFTSSYKKLGHWSYTVAMGDCSLNKTGSVLRLFLIIAVGSIFIKLVKYTAEVSEPSKTTIVGYTDPLQLSFIFTHLNTSFHYFNRLAKTEWQILNHKNMQKMEVNHFVAKTLIVQGYFMQCPLVVKHERVVVGWKNGGWMR